MNMNTSNDRSSDRALLMKFPTWNTDGVIRRKQRQLMRKWARRFDSAHGKRSWLSYCEYVRSHQDRVGGITE
jgi:hypothetical protein